VGVFTPLTGRRRPVLPPEGPFERAEFEEPDGSRDARYRETVYLGLNSILCAASSRCSRRYAPGVVPIRSNGVYAWRTDMWCRRASSATRSCGSARCSRTCVRIISSNTSSGPSPRYRGDDVPQRHREHIDRGAPGVQPLQQW
jgi:hypothetical protein